MDSHSPFPSSVQALITEFARLPGIGKRTAERLAYHVLASPSEEAMGLAVAIRNVKKNMRACKRCFNVAEEELCPICANKSRDDSIICVVELPRDIMAVEKTGAYKGMYHVLQGHLSPSDGIGPDQLRISNLKTRITEQEKSGSPVRELILALNPTSAGDATAHYIAEEFAPLGVRITHLARGLSSGTEIESSTPSSLQFALEGRRDFT